MSFRYGVFTRHAKKLCRRFFPVQKSSYTLGDVADICAVNLVPPEKLQKFFAESIQRLQAIKGDDIGDYLEFGVFNGSSMASMYTTCKGLHVQSRLFGFDAFQGLPAGAENEDDGVWKKGFYTCSFEKMQECLRRRDVNGDDIRWVKGWYEDSLQPEAREQLGLKNLGVVFIDCDTYSSSKAVLEFIRPLLTSTTILCFDDWKLNDLDIKGMGEYKSFNEFVEANPHLHVQEISSYNRKSKSFLVSVLQT